MNVGNIKALLTYWSVENSSAWFLAEVMRNFKKKVMKRLFWYTCMSLIITFETFYPSENKVKCCKLNACILFYIWLMNTTIPFNANTHNKTWIYKWQHLKYSWLYNNTKLHKNFHSTTAKYTHLGVHYFCSY